MVQFRKGLTVLHSDCIFIGLFWNSWYKESNYQKIQLWKYVKNHLQNKFLLHGNYSNMPFS